LQQIHLLDQSSSSENLEQLGPIIKQIHTNRQQDAYLRTLQGLIDSKDAEIEKTCGDNYQDFISSVSTLFTVKSYTHNLRDKIATLDSSVSQIGHGVAEKKRALLQSKKTATNLDEAIDSLQASLRILDVVHRVGEMVKEGKYWSALRVCDTPFLHPDKWPNNYLVPGRYPEHAPVVIIPDPVIPAYTHVAPLSARANQGRCYSLYKAMVVGNP
jgi:hypothetical protein